MIGGALELLLFRDGGIRFGVYQDQVLAVQTQEAEFAGSLLHFQEALGSPIRPAANPDAVVLSLRTEPPSFILVDAVESMAEIPTSELRPLPPLAEARVKAKGLWGVALVKGEMVLLADFRCLSGNPLSH